MSTTPITITVLGARHSGKSSYIERMKYGHFQEDPRLIGSVDATVEVCFKGVKYTVKLEEHSLPVLSGTEDGVLVCFKRQSKDTFDRSIDIIRKIQKSAPSVAITWVSTHCDEVSTEVSDEMIIGMLLGGFDHPYKSISAKNSIRLEDPIISTLEMLL